MNEPSPDWARRQRDFRHRFGAERDGMAPMTVQWRATPATIVATSEGFNALLAEGILTSMARSIARLRKRGPSVVPVPYLTVWTGGDGAPFTFDIAEPPSFAYEGAGQLYGALTAGGTLVVVTEDGEPIWPASPPRPATD
jgi:hypothetical protein